MLYVFKNTIFICVTKIAVLKNLHSKRTSNSKTVNKEGR